MKIVGYGLTQCIFPDLDRAMCLPITFMHVNPLNMVRSGVGNMECLALKDVVVLLWR